MQKIYSFCFFSLFSLSVFAQNGLNLDPTGTADYVQTTFAGITGSADRTFEAWIYLSSTPTGNTAISDYGTNAVGSRNTFFVNANLQLGFISGGTNANMSSTNNAVPLNQWAHVAFVLKNGTGYLYVDGLQVGTSNLSTVNTPSGNTDLRIGQRVPGGTIPFKGTIDEYRMWNVARTSAELIADKNSEFCALPSGLVAYYKLNEGSAGASNTGITTATEEIAGADGTLQNFALNGNSSNWVTGASISAGLAVNNLSLNECDGFSITVGNTVYDSTGTYSDTLVGAALNGCDSVVNLNLTVSPQIDTSVSVASPSLSANQSGANYQWLNCNSNYAPIPGATSQTFTAALSGQYAVEITIGNCVDTSACKNLVISGFNLNDIDFSQVSIYPNPVKDLLFVDLGLALEDLRYSIHNLTGQTLEKGHLRYGKEFKVDVSNFKPGAYLLKVGDKAFPFIKE